MIGRSYAPLYLQLYFGHQSQHQISNCGRYFLQQHLVLHRSPDAAILLSLEFFLGQLFQDMNCLNVLSSQKLLPFDLSYNT